MLKTNIKTLLLMPIFSISLYLNSLAMINSEDDFSDKAVKSKQAYGETQKIKKQKTNHHDKKISIGQITRDSSNYDKTRELFYIGLPLSDFPKIDRASHQRSFCKDARLGYFESPVEQYQPSTDKERLLITDDHTNSIFESSHLMKLYDGDSSKETDRREKVNTPFIPPWSAVSSLELLFHESDKKTQKHYSATYFGSGALIDFRFILTAAHNVYDIDSGFLVNKVKAFPGLDNGTKYWEASSTKYHINPEYFLDPSPQNDIALVDFEDSFKGKEEEGLFSFGFGHHKQDELHGKQLTITGFPGGAILESKIQYLGCKTMIKSTGTIEKTSNPNDGILVYNIDTTKGNSGSPIYFKDEEKIICCGVHNTGGKDFNKGAHINKQTFELINQWIKK